MDDLAIIQSAWWTDLRDFGDLVLRSKRKAMGMTQEQMAAKIGVHRTRISRIEKGLGVPKDIPTGRAYAQEYKLSADEAGEMFRLWFGMDSHGSYLEREIKKQYSSLPDMLYRIRIDGSPKLVITFVKDRSEQLREYIKHLDRLGETVFYKKILTRMIREQITALMEITPRHKMWNVSHDLIEEIAKIANECHDINLRGLADLYFGGIFYIARNYPKSLYYVDRALQDVSDVDAQLRLLRYKALDLANLNEKTKVKKVDQHMLNTVEQGNFSTLEQVSSAYEGLGMARSLVLLPQALESIQTGWAIYSKIESEGDRVPFRSLQLARSELAVITKLLPTEKRLIERRGMEFVRLAQMFGYDRHEKELMELLKTNLD